MEMNDDFWDELDALTKGMAEAASRGSRSESGESDSGTNGTSDKSRSGTGRTQNATRRGRGKQKPKKRQARKASDKEMKKLAKAVTWRAIWPIILIGGLLMMFWSVYEGANAVDNRHFALEKDADGEYIVPDDDAYYDYLSEIHLGLIRKGVIRFFYGFFRLPVRFPWAPKMLYRFTVAVLWFVLSGISVFVGKKKEKNAGFKLREAESQYKISIAQYQRFLERANMGGTFKDRLDLANFCFVALAVIVSIFQFFFIIMTRFAMTPILVLEIVFLIMENIKHKASRFNDEDGSGVTNAEKWAQKAEDLVDEARELGDQVGRSYRVVKESIIGQLIGWVLHLPKIIWRSFTGWLDGVPGFQSLKDLRKKKRRERARRVLDEEEDDDTSGAGENE